MKSILIDHPNRLGDHLIFAGLVREYCKHYDRVGIFSVPKYASSVSYFFRDLTNLTIEVLPTHRHKVLFCLLNPLGLWGKRYGKILHVTTDQELGVLFERQYYAIAGVPFEKKWDNFHLERDPKREEEIFKKVVPSTPYAFVHDDGRYPMKAEKLPSGMPLVRPTPGITDNFFEWALVIERAAEVHAIDSSFMFLTDLLPSNPAQRLFVHRYSRQPNVLWNMPVLKKPWQILL